METAILLELILADAAESEFDCKKGTVSSKSFFRRCKEETSLTHAPNQ